MINYGEVTRKYVGGLMKEKSYSSKVCLCKLVSALTPPPILLFSSWYRGGEACFPNGKLCSASRQVRRGQRTLPESVHSQLPSAQSNP